jgi:hypothetical protein
MTDTPSPPRFGSSDLAMPDDLRGPLLAHLRDLRTAYVRRDWAARVGFGNNPAVIAIDLARYWSIRSRSSVRGLMLQWMPHAGF